MGIPREIELKEDFYVWFEQWKYNKKVEWEKRNFLDIFDSTRLDDMMPELKELFDAKFQIKDDIIYVDVDHTLINPLDLDADCIDKGSLNWGLIEAIKEWKSKGKSIIVWTSNVNGVSWAKKATKVCGLTAFVDLHLPKPHTIVDDDHLNYYKTIDPITLEIRCIRFT